MNSKATLDAFQRNGVTKMPSDGDIVVEARELLANAAHGPLELIRYAHGGGRLYREEPRDLIADFYDVPNRELYYRAPELLRALADEVDHARRALKGMVELWDASNPDDPCGCVGASDDCKHPPPCELCVARLIMEGRTKELFE